MLLRPKFLFINVTNLHRHVFAHVYCLITINKWYPCNCRLATLQFDFRRSVLPISEASNQTILDAEAANEQPNEDTLLSQYGGKDHNYVQTKRVVRLRLHSIISHAFFSLLRNGDYSFSSCCKNPCSQLY